MSGLSEGIQIAMITALSVTVPPLIGLLVYSLLYIRDRRNQVRQQRFVNYHNLVSDLVEGRPDQEITRLDSQIAVVYELRNYREYREVSIRILRGLRQRWSGNPDWDRLIVEIDYTPEKLQEGALIRD